jgi:hypothetical protein
MTSLQKNIKPTCKFFSLSVSTKSLTDSAQKSRLIRKEILKPMAMELSFQNSTIQSTEPIHRHEIRRVDAVTAKDSRG